MDPLWLIPSGVVLVGTPFVGRALARARQEARRTAVAMRALSVELDRAAVELGVAGQRFRAALEGFEAQRGGLPPRG